MVCCVHPFDTVFCYQPKYLGGVHVLANIQREFVAVVRGRSGGIPLLARVQVYYFDCCIVLWGDAVILESVATDGVRYCARAVERAVDPYLIWKIISKLVG